MKKITSLFVCLITLLLVVGCGGGGGGGDESVGDNNTPTADAGVNQNVTIGSTVTLDGSASSDADGDSLTWSWTLTSMPSGSSATLSASSAVKPSFIADLDGAYVFSLVVNDGMASSVADSVTITAATVNSAPVANAGTDQSVKTLSTVTLDGSASSDADGDSLSYSWTLTAKPAGSGTILSNSGAVKPTFIADLDGAYFFSLVVNDGIATSRTDNVVVTAATANSAPVVNAGLDQYVAKGSSVTLDGSASSDADSDPLSYSWTLTAKPSGSGAFLSNNSAVKPTFVADLDGEYVFSLVVNDGTVSSSADSVTVTAVTATPPPACIGLVIDPISLTIGTPLNQTIEPFGTKFYVFDVVDPATYTISLYNMVTDNDWSLIGYVSNCGDDYPETIPTIAESYNNSTTPDILAVSLNPQRYLLIVDEYDSQPSSYTVSVTR